MRGTLQAVVGSLLIAAVSTLGDFVWARYIPAQQLIADEIGGKAIAGDEVGGLGRDRTADTRIFSPLLYQLSYQAVTKGPNGRPALEHAPARAVNGRGPIPLKRRESVRL